MKINIVVQGTTEPTYAINLKNRLKAEDKIDAKIVETVEEADKRYPILIEYQPASHFNLDPKQKYIIEVHGVPTPKRLLLNFAQLMKTPDKAYANMKFALGNPSYVMNMAKRIGTMDLKALQDKNTLLFRTKESAKMIGIGKYKIMPLVDYPKVKIKLPKIEGIHLGSISYAFKTKNQDLVAKLVQRLNVECTIISSISTTAEGADPQTEKAMRQIAQELYDKYNSDKIHIIIDKVDEKRKQELLSKCTHFFNLQDETWNVSWSIRDMAKFRKPVITFDTIAGREANAYLIKDTSQINMDYLKRTTKPIYPPDGLPILVKLLKGYK